MDPELKIKDLGLKLRSRSLKLRIWAQIKDPELFLRPNASYAAGLRSFSVVSLCVCLLGKSSAGHATSHVGHSHTGPQLCSLRKLASRMAS